MQKLIPFILFLLSASFVFGQNEIVQSFNFESTTRDTVITFPEGDHNKYERILMHYGMRCTDGLVSTGAERNKGCGEWDYSCNTYVVDSTKVDSITATSPEFDMPGFAGEIFDYRTISRFTVVKERRCNIVLLFEYSMFVQTNLIGVYIPIDEKEISEV